jgi:HEPN domain-containing protein
LARQPLPPGCYLEDLCFLCQQAAELAIKAVFLQHGWRFAYVHDLGELLDALKSNGLSVPAQVQGADRLSIFASQTRYPSTVPPVTRATYEDAVRVAEAVIAWAEGQIP